MTEQEKAKIAEEAYQWSKKASDDHELWGIRIPGRANTDKIAFVNDVIPLAYEAGATRGYELGRAHKLEEKRDEHSRTRTDSINCI